MAYVSSAAAARRIARDKLREKLGWNLRWLAGWEAEYGQDVVVFKDEAGGCVWRAVYEEDGIRDEDYTNHTVAVHQRYMPQDKIQHGIRAALHALSGVGMAGCYGLACVRVCACVLQCRRCLRRVRCFKGNVRAAGESNRPTGCCAGWMNDMDGGAAVGRSANHSDGSSTGGCDIEMVGGRKGQSYVVPAAHCVDLMTSLMHTESEASEVVYASGCG